MSFHKSSNSNDESHSPTTTTGDIESMALRNRGVGGFNDLTDVYSFDSSSTGGTDAFSELEGSEMQQLPSRPSPPPPPPSSQPASQFGGYRTFSTPFSASRTLPRQALNTAQIMGTCASVLAVAVVVISLVWLGILTGLWIYNLKTTQHDIRHLNRTIAAVNASIPEGNGTVFFDDEWLMANGPHPGRKFQLNASLVTGGTTRNYAGPDADGIILLDTTLNPVFPEDQFAVVGDTDATTRIEFDLSLIPSATLHLYSWPNKDGTVAMLSDIIASSNNHTTFLDSTFAILNAVDTSKRAQFYAGLITSATNHTYSFPDLTGVLALIAGAQTLSDKTIDNSNSITVVDSNLAIQDTAGGNSALFNANSLSGDQTFSFPDLTGTFVLTTGVQLIEYKTLDNTNTIIIKDNKLTIQSSSNAAATGQFTMPTTPTSHTYTFADSNYTVVGRSGTAWDYTSLAMDSLVDAYKDIRVVASNGVDRFFAFRGQGPAPTANAGILLSSFSTNNFMLYNQVGGTFASDFVISFNATYPTGYNELGTTALSIDHNTLDLRLHKQADETIYAELDVSGLTAARTVSFQDKNCTLACISDIGTPTGFFATGGPSIPNGVATVATYTSVSGVGRNNLGSNFATGTGAFTVPVTGYYSFSANAVFSTSTAGTQRTFYITINGDFLSGVLAVGNTAPIASASVSLANAHVYLTASQIVNTVVTQDSGSSMSVSVYFSGTLVSQA